eukprot:scaffold8982_cov65-Phaeocystis_antarctica.AAC.3
MAKSPAAWLLRHCMLTIYCTHYGPVLTLYRTHHRWRRVLRRAQRGGELRARPQRRLGLRVDT